MWARIFELFFGVWFFISPWILHTSFSYKEVVFSFFILGFSLFSFSPKYRKAHLSNLLIALILMGFVIIQKGSLPYATEQNYLVLSLLLLLFGIIPSKASDHPSSWLEFYEKKRKE